MRILLGSKSPRRRELLAGLDIDFEIVDIDADERFPETLKEGDIPLYISRAKARAYMHKLGVDDLLVTADTIVWCDGRMLGKPRDTEDAKAMLRLLSGKTHQVYTGVCLTKQEGEVHSFVCRTDVSFRELDEAEIEYYIERYKPFDKAGAYGIQEWIGYAGCTSLEGSYFNVMGLPVERLYEALVDRCAVRQAAPDRI